MSTLGVATERIHEWPAEWYRFAKCTFRLQARSQLTPRQLVGGTSVYGPHAQVWVAALSLTSVEQWDKDGQAMAAFFSRLEGRAGLLRMGHVMRLTAQANRLSVESQEDFSDDTLFDDNTGMIVKPVPPVCTLAAPAARGDKYIVLGGLPASQPKLLRRGDLIELRPNGAWGPVCNLHEVMVPGSTDADGKTGVEIRPRLNQGFAFGDMAVLDDARGLFQLVDDDQGSLEASAPDFVSMGFNLVQWTG